MIKIIATLCSLVNPNDCHDTMITSSDFEALTLSDCYDQAKLAGWMKQYPGESVKKITCVLGRRDDRAI